MAYNVDISSTAEKEIDKALRYIAVTLGSPLAMQSLANSIEEALAALSAYPDIYPIDNRTTQYTDLTIRRVNAKRYWLYYLIDFEKKTVMILSFLHSRQSKARLIEDIRSQRK